MTSKEQRRGVRMDLEQLREFVKENPEYIATKGKVAIRFGWAHAKLFSMFRQCAEAYDDIDLISGSLIFLGPYPAKEESS